MISFSVLETLKIYWPVLLVLIGISVILEVRWFGWLFFVVILLLAGAFMGDFNVGLIRQIVQEIPYDNSTQTIDLNMDYGAGIVYLTSGKDSLVRLIDNTTDDKDPIFTHDKKGATENVAIKRNPQMGYKGKDIWRIEVNPDADLNMKLNYGAAEVSLDLTDLKAKNLEIDTGASKTEIIFGDYPTKAVIDTGASSLEFKFPKDAGAKVIVDGGAVRTELNGFSKVGKAYYSKGYDENQENIDIEIHAGASSIKGEFY